MNMLTNPTTIPTPTLDVLAKAWQQAKNAEKQANAERIAIEAQIAELVGVKEEGTITAECDGFKIKTVGKLTRTIDTQAVQMDWDSLPAEVQACIKWKADLDTKNLRSLESMRTDLVPVISQYMTTKPAKASVTVEQLEEVA